VLTKAQIQRLAQRHGVGMQVQERDYLQHLLLWRLYARSQELVFKGGTALRLVYRGNRYSEDLDFNGPADRAALQALWQQAVVDLGDLGIAAEIREPWGGEMGYSFDVSYHGPLYDGRDRSKGKVRVDISQRAEEVATLRELVASPYDDVRPFVVTVLTLPHLLAEKVRALLVRSKPRDLYDIWLLLRQDVPLDPQLIAHKLRLYDLVWEPASLEQALVRVQGDWERDLRPLLPQFVTYAEVRAGVTRLVEMHREER